MHTRVFAPQAVRLAAVLSCLPLRSLLATCSDKCGSRCGLLKRCAHTAGRESFPFFIALLKRPHRWLVWKRAATSMLTCWLMDFQFRVRA